MRSSPARTKKNNNSSIQQPTMLQKDSITHSTMERCVDKKPHQSSNPNSPTGHKNKIAKVPLWRPDVWLRRSLHIVQGSGHRSLSVAEVPSSSSSSSSSSDTGPISECISTVPEKSSPSSSVPHQRTMALVDRKELVIGSLLGHGAFCEVHALRDIHLVGDDSCSGIDGYEEDSSNNNIDKARQQLQILHHLLFFSKMSHHNTTQQQHPVVSTNHSPYQDTSTAIASLEQTNAREQLRRTCRMRPDEDYDDDGSPSPICQDDNTEPRRHPSCRYVVKHLRPGLAQERGHKVFIHAAADLVMEFRLLSRLSHPNIVQLVGGGKGMMSTSNGIEQQPVRGAGGRRSNSSNGTTHSGSLIDTEDFFIILERLDETLSQRIQRWKEIDCCCDEHHNHHCLNNNIGNNKEGLSGEYQKSETVSVQGRRQGRYLEKLRYGRDMASAVAYLHKNNYIFRDLKPDNVMFGPDGTIKLVDFGLCRELPKVGDSSSLRHSTSTPTGVHRREIAYKMSGVGTRRYMAPEVISGQRYNQKIDCYSWAMVFLELLSLEKPFALYSREVHRILVCENQERPVVPSNIPPDAQDLLKRAWAQHPSDRPSMQQIYDELGIILDCAERQALSPSERSLRAVMEMADLLTLDDEDQDGRADSSIIFCRRSNANLTRSTSASGSVTTKAESLA